jgi:hypothetical protein
MTDLTADDHRLLADLEWANTYPQLDRRMGSGGRRYSVTLWPPGGVEAVTTAGHPTPGAALAEAAALAGR